MLEAITLLLIFQLAGEALALHFALPVPGLNVLLTPGDSAVADSTALALAGLKVGVGGTARIN